MFQTYRSNLLLASLLIAYNLPAQQAVPTQEDMKKMVAMMRKDAQKDRIQAVNAAMELDSAQSAKFWPIYDQYTAEREKVNDRLLAGIKDYAANYSNMTDTKADELADVSMKLDADRLAIRRKYYGQVKAALGAKTAARFAQVEGMLDAVRRLQIGSELPLIK